MIDLDGSLWEQRHGQGFRGAIKTPPDIARLEILFTKLAPVAWVLEMGTYNGCAATWIADTAHCQVATVDTHPCASPETKLHPDITWITGNSTAPDVVAYIKGLIRHAHGNIILILDSDHRASHVLAELEAYTPMIPVGSYTIVEDGVVRWLPEQLVHYDNSSPLDAIEQFLEHHPDEWVVDSDLEDAFRTTQNPSGYLRRIA